MSTSSKIINLLNRQAFTVNELAKSLSISRNASHIQITKLEAQGLIEKKQQRHGKSAGKPAFEYRTVAGKEDAFSTAYKPMLDVFVQTMGDTLPEKDRSRLFKKAGRTLATNEGLKPSGDPKLDLEKALEAVNSLGALAELTCENNKNRISCYSCPVATLVHSEPLTCQLVGAFFAEATGKKVAVKCCREDRIVCGFEIEN